MGIREEKVTKSYNFYSPHFRGILNNHFIVAVTALDRDEGAEICWRVFFIFLFVHSQLT